MDDKPQRGRPKSDPESHKKNRAISLTAAEYAALKALAKKEKLGVSAFIVRHHKLS